MSAVLAPTPCETPKPPAVLILGGGGCGRAVAAALSAAGAAVILSDPGPISSPPAGGTPQRVLAGTRLRRLQGAAGDFHALLQGEAGLVRCPVSHVVIALDGVREPCHAAYGLAPSPRAVPLSRLEGQAPPLAAGQVALFLLGLSRESSPEETACAMHEALRLQSQGGARCYLLTRNLKVAGAGLERLYRDCRQAGVVVVKLGQDGAEVRQGADGRVTAAFRDEVTREACRITADVAIVDEAFRPSAYLAELAAALDLHTGPDGFIGSGNVHRRGVFTNRRGIVAAGPARGLVDDAAQAADALQAALAVQSPDPVTLPTAAIDSGHCVKCLTCYRLCPYRAVVLRGQRPVIAAQACEGCGLCAAECPCVAIGVQGLDRAAMGRRLDDGLAPRGAAAPLVVFGCGRSALPALEEARDAGLALPPRLAVVGVPCAGAVSSEHLLAAFARGAGGVLVLGCHDGNCHSETGTRHAGRRVEHLALRLPALGIDARRLRHATLAANMGAELVRLIGDFAAWLDDPARPGPTDASRDEVRA